MTLLAPIVIVSVISKLCVITIVVSTPSCAFAIASLRSLNEPTSTLLGSASSSPAPNGVSLSGFKTVPTSSSFASAFAYLANAVGFEAKVISSGGHGWAEIKGEVCDPNWAKGTGHIERYYRMSYDLSGVDGRPYYRGNRAYVITI